MCWHMLIIYGHTFWSVFDLLFAYFSRLPSAVKPKMIYQRQTVLVDFILAVCQLQVCVLYTHSHCRIQDTHGSSVAAAVLSRKSIDYSLPKLLARFSE